LQPIACLVDIEELIADNSFEIYTNPTNGIVTIKTNDQYYENFKVEIFDALGRKVNSDVINSGSGEYSTNLGNYPEGLYIVRIYTNEFSINKKLLLTK
ncbi:MAG: T9SS type A sorting domain-containing protein, partial [Bacteroidales bacterium]|nr:T9SS type A sorting domain-containing protein [Bacteroidales bacterium]